jgi:hypothetical protein
MATRRFFLCLCAVAPLLGACVIPASIMEALDQGAVPDVEPHANAYNQDLRWGRVRQASLMVVPEDREKFFELFDEDQSTFHFTSVEVLSAVPRSADGFEVDVLVAWEYYSPPALDERKIRQKQTWRYILLEKRWEVEPDFAVFEAALAPYMRARGPVPASPAR